MTHRRFLHASLNHRAPKRATALNLADRILELDVDYCGATEGRPEHVEVLRNRLAKTHDIGRRGEYLFITRREIYRRLSKDAVGRAVMVTVTPRIDVWRQTFVGRMWYDDRETGTRIPFALAHFPATVQSGKDWRDDSRFARAQVKTAKAAWPKVGSDMRGREWANWDRNWVGWLSYDGNQHLGAGPVGEHWRTWQQNQLGGVAAWTADRVKGQPGTHAGGRIIDGAHGYGDIKIVGTRVDRAPNPGDHQFVIFDVEYPVERRRRPHRAG